MYTVLFVGSRARNSPLLECIRFEIRVPRTHRCCRKDTSENRGDPRIRSARIAMGQRHNSKAKAKIAKSRVCAVNDRRVSGCGCRCRCRCRRQLLLRFHHLQFAHNLRVFLQEPSELAPPGLGLHLDLFDSLSRTARTVERCLRRRVPRAALPRQSVQVGAVAQNRVRVHVVHNETANTSESTTR